MGKKENKNEPKFNEAQAYEELRMIIAIAIETQNFASLEPNIAIWENKYPLENFVDPEIIRKIKAILNKDYLSRLIGDYMASLVLHEQKKQQEAYESLKQIIETAKKNKDYKTAKKEIAVWKATLYDNGLSITGFNKYYEKQIFRMLLLPSKELHLQEEASNKLKEILDNARKPESESKQLLNDITLWQNRYVLDGFPDDLKKEINNITADVLNSISIRRTEENAVQEIAEYISSKQMNSPAEEIPVLLSKYDYDSFSDEAKKRINTLTVYATALTELSLENKELKHQSSGNDETKKQIVISKSIPLVQQEALYDLKNIFSKNARDLEEIFNWIYLNREINFVPKAIDEIKTLFSTAGFSKPSHGEYSIPSLKTSIDELSLKDVARIREDAVLSYLGILYMDNNKLTDTAKSDISSIRDKQELLSTVSRSPHPIVLTALDNDVLIQRKDISDSSASEYDKEVAFQTGSNDRSAKKEIEESIPQEVVDEDLPEISILIDDLLKDPLDEIAFHNSTKQNKEEINPYTLFIVPESSEDEATYSVPIVAEPEKSEATTNTLNQTDENSIVAESIEAADVYSVPIISEPQRIETTMSTLTEEDKESIAYISYLTTTYYIEQIPIHKTHKKSLTQDYNYPEKNNGF